MMGCTGRVGQTLTRSMDVATAAQLRRSDQREAHRAHRWLNVFDADVSALDAVAVSLLVATAILTRWHGLPTDGLWIDDARAAVGLKAPLSQLFTAGPDFPGFISALIGWRWLSGGGDVILAYPALIAGIISPALLYCGLRRLGYDDRSALSWARG